jgi:hypothetical protein
MVNGRELVLAIPLAALDHTPQTIAGLLPENLLSLGRSAWADDGAQVKNAGTDCLGVTRSPQTEILGLTHILGRIEQDRKNLPPLKEGEKREMIAVLVFWVASVLAPPRRPSDRIEWPHDFIPSGEREPALRREANVWTVGPLGKLVRKNEDRGGSA